MGFNGAETNCGIAHILSLLLMNSYDVISLFPLSLSLSLSLSLEEK